ncbi:nuclear transport factor 2 family protein [Dactylosporangium salmoneum]|uniref:SnoaL-like domain-containing protein n=1 Tax=Dactylosporangium salmoneum TaxID=53361 RepID=A0ABN3GS32_9ACTN
MCDVAEISQLILDERQGRDRGWWDQMRRAFWPDSIVQLSWFTGSGPDFVTRSAQMSGRGDRSVHRVAAPVVHVRGDRAHAEVSTTVEFQIDYDGVPAHLVSYTRLNYRLTRRDGRWGVESLDAVYERDTLTPAIPGGVITVDPEDIAKLRPSYALIAHYLQRRGYPVRDDLLGDDRPDQVDAFYAELLGWLEAGGDIGR